MDVDQVTEFGIGLAFRHFRGLLRQSAAEGLLLGGKLVRDRIGHPVFIGNGFSPQLVCHYAGRERTRLHECHHQKSVFRPDGGAHPVPGGGQLDEAVAVKAVNLVDRRAVADEQDTVAVGAQMLDLDRLRRQADRTRTGDPAFGKRVGIEGGSFFGNT